MPLPPGIGLTKKTTIRNCADFAYKPKKFLKIPFGLETTTAPLLEEILAEDSSLADSVVYVPSVFREVCSILHFTARQGQRLAGSVEPDQASACFGGEFIWSEE